MLLSDILTYFFGHRIYVWKDDLRERGNFRLAFTNSWRRVPPGEHAGWSQFKPHRFPRRTSNAPAKWCRVFVPRMLTEVYQKGYYIAPPLYLVLARYTTTQLYKQETQTSLIERYAYMWHDTGKPSDLPAALNGQPIERPWKFDRSFDISHRLDREAVDFWVIQDVLERFGIWIEPNRLKMEEDRARAEEERREALRQEQLRQIELQKRQIGRNEVCRTQWPYKSWWWPKPISKKSYSHSRRSGCLSSAACSRR